MNTFLQWATRWSWVPGLVGALALIGAVSNWYVYGSTEGATQGLAVVALVGLVAYLVFDRQRVGDAMSSRAFLYGSGSTLMMVMATAIGVGAYVLARDHDQTWDLTERGAFTLSDHTTKVLSGLSEPVEVLAFFRRDTPEEQRFRDLVDRYAEGSTQLAITWIDPLREPRRAEQHGIQSENGAVILRSGDRERRLEVLPDEERLTQAILLLLSDEEHTICWSVGHGEADPDDEMDERGMGAIVLALEALNYQVMRMPVATRGIERSCDALVVARPAVEWLPYAREALAAYLAEGGQVLFMAEPSSTPELAAELLRFGAQVGDDLVVDMDPQNMLLGVDEPSFVVMTRDNFAPHPVTQSLHAAVVLGMARSVTPAPREGLNVQPLLRTGPNAWAETDLESPEIGPGPDERVGEVPVMVAIEVADPAVLEVQRQREASEPTDLHGDVARAVPEDFTPDAGGRMIVIGDSDFASNVFVSWGNNRDLFLNAIAWLVDEPEQIGERPDDGDTLEVSAAGEALLCLLSVFFVPGSAFAFAMAVLLRRRWL